MKLSNALRNPILVGALAMVMISGGLVAQDTAVSPDPSVEPSAQELEAPVQDEVDSQIFEKREKLIQEAITAVEQSKAALNALDENRSDDALEALAVVTGKLELIMARDPDLSLAPMDVGIATHDVIADVETIEMAVETAQNLLGEGKIQEARSLLAGLGSEIIVSVTNIPLATYPTAIKEVVPLIDAGEMEEAKAALQLALNTLVVTESVIPLPVVRAQLLLDEADIILESKDRTVEQTAKLPDLVDEARAQFEIAQALGYVNEEDLEELRAEWNRIVAHVTGEAPEEGVFDKIQSMLARAFDGE